ncbi:DMT family transporter [Mycoplasmatota bacterium]|nr:DMT family transporter [Mycoplasmatota bacterium]
MKYKHLAGIGFSIIFGLSFLFSKQALEFVSPIGLIAYRFLIAWLFFMLAYVFKLVKIQFDKKMFKYLLLCGLFQPVIYFMTESYGLNLLGTGEAGLMIAIIPIFVTILSAIFLKEMPRKSQIIFMLMSIIGVMVIQLSQLGHDNQLLGFVFMFIAVIAASLFNITSRYISKTVTPITSTFFMTTMGALVFNTIYTIELLLNDSLSLYITNLNHIELIIPILYLGIVASVGGFFLVNTTLKHMPAHVSSIYTNISTVIAIVAGLLFLNEYLYIYHYIGAVLILVGVYGTVKFQSTKSHISN